MSKLATIKVAATVQSGDVALIWLITIGYLALRHNIEPG